MNRGTPKNSPLKLPFLTYLFKRSENVWTIVLEEWVPVWVNKGCVVITVSLPVTLQILLFSGLFTDEK